MFLIVLSQMDLLQSSKKSAAFIYNYQAATSESQSKVRLFSPFPQPPPGDLTAVDSLIDLVSNSHKKLISLNFVETVASNEPCPIAMCTSRDRTDSLRSLKLLHDGWSTTFLFMIMILNVCPYKYR